MITLRSLPLVALRADDRLRLEREVRDRVIAEGRAAYRFGLPVTACPPFVDGDKAIDWRNGWRWEKEEWEERRMVTKIDGVVYEEPEDWKTDLDSPVAGMIERAANCAGNAVAATEAGNMRAARRSAYFAAARIADFLRNTGGELMPAELDSE